MYDFIFEKNMEILLQLQLQLQLQLVEAVIDSSPCIARIFSRNGSYKRWIRRLGDGVSDVIAMDMVFGCHPCHTYVIYSGPQRNLRGV